MELNLQSVPPDSKEMAEQTSSVRARVLSKQGAIEELPRIASIESARKTNWEGEWDNWNNH